MTTSYAAGGSPAHRSRVRRGIVVVASGLAIIAVAVATARNVSAPSPLVAVGGSVFVGIAVWMFFSKQPEWPLALFALYLGLLDGYLKLRTGVEALTLARDVLLYAIVLGILARAALRRQRLVLPPLGGWVLAFVAVVLVQLFNPADGGVIHALGALRPHLEFVPLFFLGHQVMRTTTRLRRFILVLLVCATANGIVSFAQFNLTPAQLSSWGAGYAAYITGTSDVSGRTYTDAAGQVKVRPFGLGTDAGSGAEMGVVALGGRSRYSPLLPAAAC